MDKKGIVTFLAVTLSLSVAVQYIAMMTTLGSAHYAMLVVPAIGAYIARRVSPSPGETRSALWPVPKIPALRIAIVTPLLFAAIFTATTLAGLTKPDWRLGELIARLEYQASEPAAAALQMENFNVVILVLGFLLTLIIAPTIGALLAVGIEYGWRGYLLPRLMPLGRWRAYTALGLLWTLSLAPLRINNPAHPALALLLLLLAMTIALSIILGEIWRRTHNIGLTAVFYGCFTTHASYMLPFLFPETRVLFPWGGTSGIIAIAVWLLIAAFPTVLFGRLEQQPQPKITVPTK